MTPKQRRFVVEYLKDGNGTQAAIRAGYSKNGAQQMASDLLLNPVIKAAVEKRIKKIEEKEIVTVEYILKSLIEIAERCRQAEPVLDKEGNETGEYKFDSSGANRSLELLGKYKKLFTDRVEHDVSKSLEKILSDSVSE